MVQNEGLQTDDQVFVSRKNKVVGKLDLAVEVIAAAFGVELDDILRKSGFLFMLVMVSHAMHTFSRGIAKTAHDVMVFGAVMKLHVPTHRDEQHGKSHQKGSD